MISNYFGINILTFPFGFIISIIFFFGIAQTNKIVLKKFQKNQISLGTTILIPFIIFSFFIAFVNIFLYVNVTFVKYFIYLIFILSLFLSYQFITNLQFNKILKIKFKKDFVSIFLILFIFSYFIISSFPLSDSDSLAYHSSFGAFMIKFDNATWLKNIHLSHGDFLLSGYTEIVNFIGLVLLIDNLGSYVNFFTLFYIFFCLKKLFYKNKSIDLVFLFIISTPILLPMIFSQKIYILPCFILSILIFLSFKQKKFYEKDFLIIFSSLLIVLSFKVSFLLIVSFLTTYFLYKSFLKKNLFKCITYLTLFFLIFFFPILFKNIYFHSDIIPPFTGRILNTNSDYLNNFAIFLNNYDLKFNLKTMIYLPLLILIPHYGQSGIIYFSLPNIGKIYGLQFYNFLFSKKKFNKKFYFIIILSLLLVFVTGNISTRWFLFLFFFMQLGFLNFNMKINIFYLYLMKFQIVLFALFVLSYSIININVLFSEEKKNNFLINHANGYDFALNLKKIKSELKLDKSDYILYSHRSYFWTNIEDKHINVANEYLNLFNFENDQMLLNSDFRDILYKKKIKLLIIRKKDNISDIVNKSFKDNCLVKHGEFISKHATRNIFLSGEKKYNWIYFKSLDLINCLK